ncbi:TRAP transporter small permease subunit [Kordiimonas aquimaris]|uniref:TRAP transporter small permease subunit n=1 Tax=Kordiimonas aquimaris TaxID=707591 RepID=UPI0021CE6716|nr:TRAP transporter small permease subunit [Kordiimonas aquimaris]
MIDTIIKRLDYFAETSGKVLSVLPLALVLVQFTVVLLVYVFNVGSIQLQESLQYINAMMFLGGAGYTALKDEHVRVDIFYTRFSEIGKSWVNFLGTLFLLIPFLILFWSATLPYVLESWAIKETSVESSGLPFIYILKTTLLLFALTMSLHAATDLLRTGKQLFGKQQTNKAEA